MNLITTMKKKEPNKKEVLSYFRANLYESYQAYNAWKMIKFSKTYGEGLLSKKMAEKYCKIQNYNKIFFPAAERAFLINFVIFVLHSFDNDKNSYSLFKIDKKKTESFKGDNIITIEKLKKLRNKLFAHKDIRKNTAELAIPSLVVLDKFFDN